MQDYLGTEERQREFAAWQAERQQRQLNKRLNKEENPVKEYRDNR